MDDRKDELRVIETAKIAKARWRSEGKRRGRLIYWTQGYNHESLGFKCEVCGKEAYSLILAKDHMGAQKLQPLCVECGYIYHNTLVHDVGGFGPHREPVACPFEAPPEGGFCVVCQNLGHGEPPSDHRRWDQHREPTEVEWIKEHQFEEKVDEGREHWLSEWGGKYNRRGLGIECNLHPGHVAAAIILVRLGPSGLGLKALCTECLIEYAPKRQNNY